MWLMSGKLGFRALDLVDLKGFAGGDLSGAWPGVGTWLSNNSTPLGFRGWFLGLVSQIQGSSCMGILVFNHPKPKVPCFNGTFWGLKFTPRGFVVFKSQTWPAGRGSGHFEVLEILTRGFHPFSGCSMFTHFGVLLVRVLGYCG